MKEEYRRDDTINLILKGELPLSAFLNELELETSETVYRGSIEHISRHHGDGGSMNKPIIKLGVVTMPFKEIDLGEKSIGPLEKWDLLGLNIDVYNKLREMDILQEVEKSDRA